MKPINKFPAARKMAAPEPMATKNMVGVAASSPPIGLINEDPLSKTLVEVQQLLRYKLNNPDLLVEALTHPSHPSGLSYDRLEYFGDAAINLAFTTYLFKKNPGLQPGPLTILRSANVCTEKLARAAVHHGLYRYLRCNCAFLDKMVEEFSRSVLNEDTTNLASFSFGGSSRKAPKVLADVVESLAAAVYIDCGYNLRTFWKVFKRLLQPFITSEATMGQLQPLVMVKRLCRERGNKIKFFDSAVRGEGGNLLHEVKAIVDDVIIAARSSENKSIAKLNAARDALSQLMPSDVSNKQLAAEQTSNEVCPVVGEVKQGALKVPQRRCRKNRSTFQVYKHCTDQGPTQDNLTEVCSAAAQLEKGAVEVIHQQKIKNDFEYDDRRHGPRQDTRFITKQWVPKASQGAGEVNRGPMQVHQVCSKNHFEYPVHNHDRERGPSRDTGFASKQATPEVCPTVGQVKLGRTNMLHQHRDYNEFPVLNPTRKHRPTQYARCTGSVMVEPPMLVCPVV